MKKTKSVAEILPLLLTRKALSSLALSVKDPRELVDITLDLTSGNSRFSLKRLANKIGFPLLVNPDLDISLAVMSKLDLIRLEKLGSFPVIFKEQVVAIWSIDPLVARAQLGANPDFPFYLGLWSDIKGAWENYRDLLKKSEQEQLRYDKTINGFFISLAEIFTDQDLQTFKIEILNFKRILVNANILLDFRDDEFVKTFDSFIKLLAEEKKCFDFDLETYGSISLEFSYSPIEKVLSISSVNEMDYLSRLNQETQANLAYKNIIVIDDSSVFFTIIQKYLKCYNYKFKNYALAKAAIKYLRRTSQIVDLIICDLHMPSHTGLEILHEVRKISRYQQTPFVILTSEKDVDFKIKSFNGGVSAYITKDEEPRVISSQIKSILENRAVLA